MLRIFFPTQINLSIILNIKKLVNFSPITKVQRGCFRKFKHLNFIKIKSLKNLFSHLFKNLANIEIKTITMNYLVKIMKSPLLLLFLKAGDKKLPQTGLKVTFHEIKRHQYRRNLKKKVIYHLTRQKEVLKFLFRERI